MSKLKCIKCAISFKDRNDPEEKKVVNRELCFYCNLIWKMFAMFVNGIPPKWNRDVYLRLDNLHIIKRKKYEHKNKRKNT